MLCVTASELSHVLGNVRSDPAWMPLFRPAHGSLCVMRLQWVQPPLAHVNSTKWVKLSLSFSLNWKKRQVVQVWALFLQDTSGQGKEMLEGSWMPQGAWVNTRTSATLAFWDLSRWGKETSVIQPSHINEKCCLDTWLSWYWSETKQGTKWNEH